MQAIGTLHMYIQAIDVLHTYVQAIDRLHAYVQAIDTLHMYIQAIDTYIRTCRLPYVASPCLVSGSLGQVICQDASHPA